MQYNKRVLSLGLPITILLFIIIINIIPGSCSAQETSEILIPYNSDQIKLEVAQRGRVFFSGEKMQMLSETGEPALPTQVVTVLLPASADMESVQAELVNVHWEQVSGRWEIEPMPPPMLTDDTQEGLIWPKDRLIKDGKDELIYTTDGLFPKDSLTHTHAFHIRQWKLAETFIMPYRYNPVQGTLHHLIRAEVRFSFRINSNEKVRKSAVGLEWVRRLAFNFDQYYREYSESSTPWRGGYAIITRTDIIDDPGLTALPAFIASKESRGYEVHIVTENDYGYGSGQLVANKIHNWLVNNYALLDVEYVLLMGDPDYKYGTVPMKLLWTRNESGSTSCYPDYSHACAPDPGTNVSKDTPSDFYYAVLTADWNYDGDNCYGEYADDFTASGNGPPRHADVIVGRIPYYPADDISVLNTILQKIVDYENTPAEAGFWRQNALLPMSAGLGSCSFTLGEKIVDDILPSEWGHFRIYDYDLTHPPPAPFDPPDPELYGCSYVHVRNTWRYNPFGLVTWATHGNAIMAENVMNFQSLNVLDDTYPSFVFQASCLNACPEQASNLAYSILKKPGIATVAATREGYTADWPYFLYSYTITGMAHFYADRLINEGMSAGEALNDLRADYVVPSAVWYENYLILNVYGCPEVGLDSFYNFGCGGDEVILDITIPSGEELECSASQVMYLIPGFHAQDGSIFHSFIDP